MRRLRIVFVYACENGRSKRAESACCPIVSAPAPEAFPSPSIVPYPGTYLVGISGSTCCSLLLTRRTEGLARQIEHRRSDGCEEVVRRAVASVEDDSSLLIRWRDEGKKSTLDVDAAAVVVVVAVAAGGSKDGVEERRKRGRIVERVNGGNTAESSRAVRGRVWCEVVVDRGDC